MSLTTEDGSSRSSPPTVSQTALPMRCEQASPTRPNGDTKPRENSSSAPTGLSGCAASRSSSEDRSSEVGKRKRVRFLKNMGKGRDWESGLGIREGGL